MPSSGIAAKRLIFKSKGPEHLHRAVLDPDASFRLIVRIVVRAIDRSWRMQDKPDGTDQAGGLEPRGRREILESHEAPASGRSPVRLGEP
jgi:hypothetical protein